MKQKLPNCLSGGVLRALSLLTLLLTLGLTSYATEYNVFNLSDHFGIWESNPSTNGYICNSGEFTIVTDKADASATLQIPTKDDGIKVYANSKITISSETVNMTKIIITATATKYAKELTYSEGWTGSLQSTVYTIENTTGSKTFTATASAQVRISSIVITGEAGAVVYPTTCETPTFSVENNAEVEVGSEILVSCGTKKSTVKIVPSDGETITGDAETAKAVYKVPNSIGQTITLTASATVQGENNEISSEDAIISIKVIAAKPFDLLTDEIFGLEQSYTIKNFTSTATNVEYYAKANVNGNNIQINTINSGSNSNGSGIISTKNPNGLIIEKIVVTLTKEVTNLSLSMSNTPGIVNDNSDKPKASVEGVDSEEITPEHVAGTYVYTYSPEASYKFFAICTNAKGAVQIVDIKVYYQDPAKAPAAPELEEGVEVTDGKITGETLAFKPVEGVSVWYKLTTETPQGSQMREPNAQGYIKYTKPVALNSSIKSVSFYAVDDATGAKSVVKNYDVDVQSGIAGIEAEAGEAVYYNLQGVRVENPVKGLYIRVANGKSQKVIL